MKAKYMVHGFDVVMRTDQARFEQFLDNLEGEVVSVVPSVFQAGSLGEWALGRTISG